MGLINALTKAEVYVGNSLEEFTRIKSILKAHGIKYKYDVVSKTSPGLENRRARTGTFGENPAYDKIYYIYVERQEKDKVKHLIGK